MRKNKVERGLALLKSLSCNHERDHEGDHDWRRCRMCLADTRVQGFASARAELAALLADYERLRMMEREVGRG